MKSELLAEKDRIQSKLSKESTSIHEYLARSHLEAKEIAASYGFNLQYAKMPNKAIHVTASSLRSSAAGDGPLR
jgi:hypothetical protein